MTRNTHPATPSKQESDAEVGAISLTRLERLKPLKAALPEDTVREIRTRLTSCGIAFVEEAIRGEQGRFSYCLRLVNDADGDTVFQTIGKGTTDAYARASAYGEMIERLQNLAFYMMLVYPSEPETDRPIADTPFKYFPDEKLLEGEELRDGVRRLTRNDPTAYDLIPPGPAIGVPFWNIFGKHTEFLPFRALQVIVGSNGMCSGNTPAEAIIHGICEVFERHVLKQLFLSPCTPPDVPLTLFEGHKVCEDLSRLAHRHGHEIRVKDCSLGSRLPVAGLLIRDVRGRYAFHLGADPSPVTALERCFTEMCQGGRIVFKDPGELAGAGGDVRDSGFWRAQLHLNIQSYEGHWPHEILRPQSDYPFQGYEHSVSSSDEDDLEYVLGVVRDSGWELLIRDNSFLEFPSYHVYIPGISEMTNTLSNTFARRYLAFDRHLHVVTNPGGATRAQRVETVRAIKRYAAAAPSRQFRPADYLMHYRQHPLAERSMAAVKELLLQPDPTSLDPSIPGCFECASCAQISLCQHAFITTLWSGLKRAMVASSWNQDDLQHLTKSRKADS